MSHKFTAKRLVILGFCMAAVLSGLLYIDQLAVSASLVDQTILFSDDFSGDLSQWSDAIGSWVIDQGELAGVGAGVGTGAWIYAGSTDWTDYFLQAKVIFVNDNAVLVARSRGHLKNEYRIDFWQQGGDHSNSYQVIKYQDDIAYDLTGGIVASPVPITNPSLIQVQLTNDHLLIYVNGLLVDNIVDSATLPKGRIGLGVDSTNSARFDNVVVSTMAPIVMLPPEQSKSGEADTTVDYSIELTNNTGAADSFTLQVLPGYSWATSLSSNQVGPILAGESITFTGSVEVPASAQHEDSDTALIQATSVTSPTLSATATLNTFATRVELAYVPLGSSDALELVDINTHTSLSTLDLAQFGCDFPQRARLSPNGAELYVMCENSDNIVILETTNLSLVDTISRPGVCQQDVTFVQAGAYALASTMATPSGCTGLYQIDVIDTTAHTILQSIPTGNYQVMSMAAHPSLPEAYAAGQQGGTPGVIFVVDTDTFTIQDTITYAGLVWDVQPSPDGQWLYASDYISEGLAKIDLSTNTVVDTLPDHGKFGLQVSPDGTQIYASEGGVGEVDVIDAATLELITTISVGAATYENALTCDGSELYVAQEAASVPVIDTQTLTTPFDITIPGASSAYGIAICPQYVEAGVYLNPTEQSQDGSRGEVVTYQQTLSNHSGITDTFTLDVIGDQWSTQLSATQVGPLADGESATFSVNVTVPVDAPWYSTDNITIAATGIISPALIAEAQITTTAFAPADITVSPTSLQSTQYTDEVTNDTLTISNGSGVPLTYTIIEGTLLGNEFSPDHNEYQTPAAFEAPSINANSTTCCADSCLEAYNYDPACSAGTIQANTQDVSWLSVNPTSGSVPTNDSDQVQVTFNATDMQAGVYETTLLINSNDPLQPQISVPVTMTVMGILPGVDINPATASQSGSPGETLVYTFTVTNLGNIADTFTLTKSSLWTTTLSDASTGVLQPAEEFTFQASVTIPPEALDGTQDQALITATSTNDSQVKDSAQATTTAAIEVQAGVDITPATASQSGSPGETFVYTFTLTNQGNVADSFTLTKSSLWTTTLSDATTGVLQPVEEFIFQASVTIPPDALDGAQDLALITATSTNDPQVKASAQTTTTALQIILVDVEILPLTAEKSGWPGETLVYTFTLTNLGNATDSFTLAKNSLWAATLSEPSTGTLQAGADFTFQLSVTVPPTALDGAQNTALVTATSANDPQVRASAQVISTAIIPIYQVLLPVVYKPCPPPIFTDNFSDPTSGWKIEEDYISKIGYLSGEYQILVKEAGYIDWSWRDFGISDYQIEVDVRPVTHLNGAMGLMFGRNTQGFYVFEISDGQYSLVRINLVPYTWTPLIDWTTSPVLYRSFYTNRLKVVRIQDSIALYANGVLLATVSDNTYTGTGLGMVARDWAIIYDTRFDNFTLRADRLGLTSDGSTVNSDTSISGGDGWPSR